MEPTNKKPETIDRREFFRSAGRNVLLLFSGSFFLSGLLKTGEKKHFWQLDPAKCVQCGRCATSCVLNPSAVKCVHKFDRCGYCNLCFAYFQPGVKKFTEAAENQLCPTNAIVRKFIEDPYYEYSIDAAACNGCAKCVKGCVLFGNGSLRLKVDYELCKNCNQCRIADNCAGDAWTRIYLEEVTGTKI